MNEPIQITLFNQRWSQVRLFLLTAIVLAAPGLAALAAMLHAQAAPGGIPPNAMDNWFLVTVLTAPLAVTMLICAGAIALTARTAARTLAAMRRGDYLVHWSYPPQTWERFDADQASAVWKGAWVGIACVMVGGVIVSLLASSAAKTRWSKMAVIAEVLGVFVLICAGVFALVGMYQFRRRRRGRKYPDAIIARHALYYAGELLVWDSAGVRLRGLGFHPAKDADGLAHVELVLGPSAAISSVNAIAGAASFSAGDSAGLARGASAAGARLQRLIAVPIGREAEAEELCRTLNGRV